MQQYDVTVIDYGVSNLMSVRNSLEHCGARVNVSSDPDVILASQRVILPGVGAFADGMAELRGRNLEHVVREVAARGHALLGICLGMQMLMEASDEFGETTGLGLIPGRVVAIPQHTVDGRTQKVPHIGWNELVPPVGHAGWDGTVLDTVHTGDAVYFVHSFMAMPSNNAHRIADCVYGGNRVAAVVGRTNVMGCQFHLEKSGEVGLNVLKKFLSL